MPRLPAAGALCMSKAVFCPVQNRLSLHILKRKAVVAQCGVPGPKGEK